MYDDYANKSAMCETQSTQLVGGSYQPPTARRQLEQKRSAIMGELARVDAAINALDAHPDLEQFTETLKAALR